MKKTTIYPLILVLALSSGIESPAQSDSSAAECNSFPLCYATSGFGANARGMNVTLNLSLTSAGGLGGSVNFTAGFMNLRDVPPDYYDGFLRIFTPADEYSRFSVLMMKKFTSASGKFRTGFTLGPSWIKYDLIRLELNPNYPGPFEYKYFKNHIKESAAGVHASAIAEIIAYDFLSAEISLFADFNRIRNVAGVELCLSLGYLRKR